MQLNNNSKTSANYGLASLIAIACILRFVAASQTQAIVQDGPLYIFQAQAIFNLHLKEALTCLPYLSSYPFLIALLYPLTQDWLLAAQLVSIACGVGTILPVYFLVQRMVSQRAALVTATIFSVLPVMVGISVNVLRDSPFWFFSAMGLYLFARSVDDESTLFPVYSCIFFLLAFWTRIEGIVFLGVSASFLLLGGMPRQRIKRCFLFCAPILITFLILLLALQWKGFAPGKIFRFQELSDRFFTYFESLSELRAQLTAIISQPPASIRNFFIEEARNSIWLVGLGVLVNRFLESLSYLYALFFLAGIRLTIIECGKDRRVLYLLLCCIGLLIIFYYQILVYWMLYYRMMATLLLPASIIIGYGAERILAFLTRTIKIRESFLFILLIGFLILFSLPKNLAVKNTGELIFRQIGETIAAANTGPNPVKLWSSPTAHRIVSFYANLGFSNPPCPEGFNDLDTMQLDDNPAALFQHLQGEGFRFFVWEESFWRNSPLTPASIALSGDFTKLHEWEKTTLGTVVVYELQ